jgi:RND family efflux transporter MFP subunit
MTYSANPGPTDARIDGPGPARRALRRIASAALTLVVLLAAGGVVTLGYGALAGRAAVSDAPPPAPALPVAPQRITLQDGHETLRRFTGQFEPRQETALAFEEGGTVAHIAVREGARVADGDPLARIDTRLLEAERDRLDAARTALLVQAELASRTNARQADLRDRGFASEQRVDDTSLALSQIEARIREADAAFAAVAVRLDKAELRAPYAGTVGERLLDLGAVASPGTPVLTLLEDGPARFRVGVAPALAGELAPGDAATIRADAGLLPARVAEITPDLDPATRARTLFLDVEGAAPPAGTTGELVLRTHVPGRGAWLPLSALRQGPRGTWQIVTVVEDGSGPVAGLEAVEVIALEGASATAPGDGRRDDGARAFVRGTFAHGALYLPSGAHRVVPGEPVALPEAAVAEVR